MREGVFRSCRVNGDEWYDDDDGDGDDDDDDGYF